MELSSFAAAPRENTPEAPEAPAEQRPPPQVRGLPMPLGDRNRNPPGMGFWSLVAEDYRTHDRKLLEPGFLAMVAHRLANARWDIKLRVLRFPVTVLCRLFYTWVSWTFGIEISYYAQVGRRLRIYHHGATMLGARSIGDDCHIRHNTTLGVLTRHDLGGLPVIGNRVDIGVGVCVAGPVVVGDDAVIAANSLVLRDVPAGGVVMGVPARLASFLPGAEGAATPPGVLPPRPETTP